MNLMTLERVQTVVMLHRFFRTALQVGRMPSLLGREIFRSRAANLPARAFEDAVVFVCDVERCLRSLESQERKLIGFCILEEQPEWAAARRFHLSQSDVSRRLNRALDLLYETFCRLGLLKRAVEPPAAAGKGAKP